MRVRLEVEGAEHLHGQSPRVATFNHASSIDIMLIPVVTPRGAPARGGHLALAHPDAWRLCQALKAAHVVADFRAPDLIRLAPAPLYTSFTDCADAIARLQHIALTRAHESFPESRALVT